MKYVEVFTIFLQDVFKELERLGIHLAQSSLRNYQNDGLIPPARRISLGRWKGTVTEYPDAAVAEIYAAYYMLNGELAAKVGLLKKVREIVLAIDNGGEVEFPYGDMVTYFACCLWIAYREKATTGIDHIVEFSTINDKPYYRCLPI
jgi:hypothetical protein